MLDMNDPVYMQDRIKRLIDDLFELRDRSNHLAQQNRFQAGKIAALTQMVLRYQDNESPEVKEAVNMLREIVEHRPTQAHIGFPTRTRFSDALDSAEAFIRHLDQPKAEKESSGLE